MAVATMPFNPAVLALLRLAYPSRARTEIEPAEIPYPVRVQTKKASEAAAASAAAKTSELGYYDERSAEDLEEARWQTALMPMSHHRDLGVAL